MNTVLRGILPGWLVGLLVLAATGSPTGAEDKKVDLQVGDAAPAFECLDDQGKPWKSAEHVGKKYLVIYFFPGDFTPGCIRQAQAFRDNMNRLVEKGVEVVGISGDSVQNHELFKKAQMLNFTLLADEDGTVAKKFGVPLGAGGQVKTKNADGKEVVLKRSSTAARWTFVVGKDGKIARKNTKVSPGLDSQQVAEFIEKLDKR